MNRYLRLTCIASLLMLPLVSFSMYGHPAGKASSKKSYVKKNAVKINKAYKMKETRIRKKAESMKTNKVSQKHLVNEMIDNDSKRDQERRSLNKQLKMKAGDIRFSKPAPGQNAQTVALPK